MLLHQPLLPLKTAPMAKAPASSTSSSAERAAPFLLNRTGRLDMIAANSTMATT
jgi:hypothetical protein